MPVKKHRAEQAPHSLQVLDFAWILVLACAFQVSQGGQVGFGQGQDAHLTSLGNGTCQTGDCGGRLECNGMGATPPASLFEVTLGTGDVKDYYDVSLVDGYNLPLVAAPVGVHGACNATGCLSDINMGCPKELQLADDYAIIFCPTANGIKTPDGAQAASMIPNPSNGKTMKLVSSSNILQPLPLLFLLLILYLTLCA
ncbi:hypothetical protein OIU74_016133 [Salix koriyanagi]|uniref:Thaumatin-like protein n=1 Tax=Salix koriyanagi TaxID=2511006 RepID=A0A9Q0PFP3_9ROSI|nr:hypothetical protein OIU74_016133 [Salix koriyanagi]